MDAITGLERLAAAVGSGTIKAVLVVDQPYAQRQHEELEWNHPRGGRAKYLEGPLFENYASIMQIVAGSLITDKGSDIIDGMSRVSEVLSSLVEENAPRLDDVLRFSGHPQVVDNGTVRYNREPKQPRVET